ncbi:MAG: ABC transporter permease [Cellvibrionales bacterium TMED49]|nr:ABC transporter permease [Porticoccaceae bacterium]OUU37691.1 MAG: ABC transporter permease [Cellvibrionales bacterium TMED49]|tara:strand:+ start:296 stop:1069 length:774 start_codon:yes stop_codon:yes gene_type:complete
MSRYEIWIAFVTIVTREVRRFLRIWPQTIIPPVVTMALFFLIFGSVIGSRIGSMQGLPYSQFVAPGLIMLSVITNSYGNVVSSFYGSKFQRNIEELMVSPTPNIIILTGYIVGGMARGLLVGLIVSLVSLFFTDLSIFSPMIALAIILLTSIMFSAAGFLNAIYADSFDDISVIPNFVLTPLIYLGGVFYSTGLLSEFWANVSLINPILYMVNTFRFGFSGVTDIDIFWAFTMVTLFTVVLFMVSLKLLRDSPRLRS